MTVEELQAHKDWLLTLNRGDEVRIIRTDYSYSQVEKGMILKVHELDCMLPDDEDACIELYDDTGRRRHPHITQVGPVSPEITFYKPVNLP